MKNFIGIKKRFNMFTITKTNLQRNKVNKQINSIKYLQKSHVRNLVNYAYNSQLAEKVNCLSLSTGQTLHRLSIKWKWEKKGKPSRQFR